MSLRPSFSGFRLLRLTKLFGCRDETLIPPLIAAFNKAVISSKSHARGHGLIRDILMQGYEGVHPEAEDEVLQIVVYCLARHDPEHDPSYSTFWEFFMGQIARGEVQSSEKEVKSLLHWLLRGRPFFGKRTDSVWSYYAYLSNPEAGRLFEFIRGVGRFQEAFDFEAANEWMDRIERTGQDVWFYAS